MSRGEKRLAAWWIAGVALIVAAVSFGCAGWRAPSYSTLTVAVRGADEARAQLPAACEVAQSLAVDKATSKPAAEAAVKPIQDRCDAALTGLEAVGKTCRTARDGIKDFGDAAKAPVDIAKWAIGALNAYRNIMPLLETLGVKMREVK